VTLNIKKKKRQRLDATTRKKMIIKNCRNLIINHGFSGLSLRNVAKVSGIGLSTLQYHFKSKEILIQALMFDTRDLFMKQSLELKAHSSKNPELQIKTISLWLINDLKSKHTAHLFTQLWAHSLMDDSTFKVMEEIYQEYCEFFVDIISKLQPKLTMDQVMERSIKIVALIEGLTIFIGSKRKSFVLDIYDIEKSTVKSILDIALQR